ncbi:semaphorin-6A-like [Notothenia coriiceps]|uniref:Semaphorin-6A-like n=1 Tax=Notothenia coriiceps TaxID=8208 RepID=A0A6I9N2N5_9TELE|nr:PREDICTED: semaphorin-6A-like [Notothenia coriiceps]
MRSEALLLYFTLLQLAGAGFPEDSEPISISHGNYTKQYPAFVGHKPGRNNTQRHKLDIQLIMIMNRTLYIAARDHIYTVDTDAANSDEIFFSKKMTWKSRQADVDTCRMKGKHKDECHNFIKVLLQQNEDTLFVCGTNAFNPSCRTYKLDTLEALGEEISGMARCPYDAKHANVALFAGGRLYSATVTDFLAIDSVIYRSLGDSPTLRTVKHDSKWLKEPYFIQAVDYGDFIYFFYREIAMEYNTMGKHNVRYRLTRIVVDNEAGPYNNHTVVFLGSEKGIIVKFLANMNSGILNDSLFLEELNVYNPDKCSIDGVDDKRIIGMQIDSKIHALWVAFSSCVVKVPLSRCERHGRCKKSCIASRDPYCGWVSEGACKQVVGNIKSAFEQDVEQGNTDGLGDCQNTFVALNDVPSSYEGHHHRHHPHTLSLPTSALPEAAEVPLGRGRMVERKDPPMSSDKGEDPYVAVPSQTQPEANADEV